LNFGHHYLELLSLDLDEIFYKHLNCQVNASYVNREDRNRFAAQEIKKMGYKKILNIGSGGKNELKKYLNHINVFDIDIVGDCDLQINLDKIDILPFKDNEFDLCLALDVLEHLENFHKINSELFRITKSSILISLPNSASEIFHYVLQNRPQKTPDLNRGTFSKFYGLPLKPPNDRHRWWLYFQDIIRFYYFFAQSHKCELEFWTERNGMKNRLIKMFLGRHILNTFFIPTVWVKLTKIKTT
jgi:hypothetical protein